MKYAIKVRAITPRPWSEAIVPTEEEAERWKKRIEDVIRNIEVHIEEVEE